jgi:PAS domain-containing protein
LTLRLITNEADGEPERPAGAGPLPDAAYRELFDNAGALLAILDAEGRFIAVSAACRRVLGHDPQALVGRSLFDFVSAHEAKASVAAGAGGDSFLELLARHRHANGSASRTASGATRSRSCQTARSSRQSSIRRSLAVRRAGGALPCSSSTWTGSRRSTTASGMTQATG